jgi:hypothetical protein
MQVYPICYKIMCFENCGVINRLGADAFDRRDRVPENVIRRDHLKLGVFENPSDARRPRSARADVSIRVTSASGADRNLHSVTSHRLLRHYWPDTCPDIARDRVEAAGGIHFPKSKARGFRKHPSLAVNPDIVDKPCLIFYPGYIHSQLRVAIRVANCAQPTHDSETK